MQRVGSLGGVGRLGSMGRPLTRKIVPSTSNKFYIVSPAGATNLVFRIIRNNDGDGSTPVASLGINFQPWRLNGVGLMSDYNGNPASPDVWLSDDLGAQDYAFQFAGIYGGSYHGGETAASTLIRDGATTVDPAVSRSLSAPSILSTSTVDWGGGNTATLTGRSLTFNPGGSITETIPVTSTLSFNETLLGMLIGSGAGFTEAALNDYGVTVPLPSGRVICRASNDITIRNPVTGHFARCQSDAPSKTGFSRTEFRNAGRSKLYHRFTGVINGVTVTRTLTFGVGASGSLLALGANLISNGDFSAGLTGWQVQAGSSAAVVGGALRLTRQAAAESRVMQPFATVVGGTYLIMATASSAADVSLNYGVTSNSNFSVSSPAPPVMQSPFVDGGSTQINVHLFIADQTTHYAMARQLAGTAGTTGDFDDIAVYRLA